MGRTKGGHNRTPAERAADELEQPTQEELDFFDFEEDIGPQISQIDIFKIQRDGSRPQCERVSVDVLKQDPYEYLRSTWGAGKYWLQFKGADRKIKGSKTIDVVARVDQQPTGPAAAPTTADKSLEVHIQFLEKQAAQQQTMLMALIQGLAGRPVPAAPDPSNMLTSVVTAFTALKQASTPVDPLGQIKPVLEFARDLLPENAGGGGGDSWAGVARDVGRGILEVMLRGPALPAGAQIAPAAGAAGMFPGQRPPQAITQGNGAAAAPPASNPPAQRSEQEWLQLGVAYLHQKAALGKDVEDYVDWCMNNLEEPACAAIDHAIKQGATIEHVLAFAPVIGENPAHVQWFTQFLSDYRAELAADADETVDQQRAGRDGPDAGNHAGAGPAGVSSVSA